MRAHFYERSEFLFFRVSGNFIFYFCRNADTLPSGGTRQGSSGLFVAEWFAWAVFVVVDNFFYGGDTESYRDTEQP